MIIGVDEKVLEEEVEPIYFEQYLNTILKMKVKEKIIVRAGSSRVKKANLSYKELSEDFIGNSSQVVYGNKVAIFILGEPRYLILIENKEIAETYRRQFGLLWSVAKK